MKRKHSDEDLAPNKKRRKNIAGDIFDDDSLSNCFCNVSDIATAVGCFSCSVLMLWNNVDKKIMLTAHARCCVSESQMHKVSITFEGDWTSFIKSTFGIMDQVLLSLDGVTSVKKQDSKSTAKLVYNDGVVLKRIRRGESCFINTWQLQATQEDNWFATPAEPLVVPPSELVRRLAARGSKVETVKEDSPAPPKQATIESSKPDRPPMQESISVEVPEEPMGAGSKSTSTAKATVQPVQAQSSNVQLSTVSNGPSTKYRRRQKKERKNAKRAALLAEAKAMASKPEAEQRPETTVSAAPVESRSQRSSIVDLSRIGQKHIDEDTPRGWLARLQHSRRLDCHYMGLKEVKSLDEKAAKALRSQPCFIGFVHGFKPPRTTPTNEFGCQVFIQDPSLFDDDPAIYCSEDLTIGFFQKRYKEWLPQVDVSDILIAQNVNLQFLRGYISGVGYHDKVKWAVYSISQGRIMPPQLANAPEAQAFIDGGRLHSPFIKVTEDEIWYCEQLAKLWKKRNPGSGVPSTTIQLGPNMSLSRGRQHRLLCDAGPEVEPQGYFDCTFEVLHGYRESEILYALHATDYTKTPRMAPCQASWCPPGLNERVVMFELWDAASKMGQDMKPGSFYRVRNARMRNSNGGYVEGKIQDNKIVKLERDSQWEPLKALLERKKEWEKENEGKQPAFPHKLLEDAQDGEYISCTVEVVTKTMSNYDQTYLRVTDYTRLPQLKGHRYNEDWSLNLEGFILSIALHGPQARVNIKTGDFAKINNLRLRDSVISGHFQGELGGSEVKIHRMNPSNTNPNLQALQKRKEDWKASLVEVTQKVANSPMKDMECKQASGPYLSIKQFQSLEKKLLKARVMARVVDYYPRSQDLWIRIWCSQCKQRVPYGRIACHSCQDIDHEFVRYKFGLMLRIEDKEGDQMDLFIHDECDILQGLQRDDPIRNPRVTSGFSRRLEQLLGSSVTSGDRPSVKLDTHFSPLVIGQFENTDAGPLCILLTAEV